MEAVYTAVNPHEKAMQRALIQYRNPKNYELVSEALHKAGRTDLIGFDKKCLIRPRNIQSSSSTQKGASAKKQQTGKMSKAQTSQKQQKSQKQKPQQKKTIRNVHKKKIGKQAREA